MLILNIQVGLYQNSKKKNILIINGTIYYYSYINLCISRSRLWKLQATISDPNKNKLYKFIYSIQTPIAWQNSWIISKPWKSKPVSQYEVRLTFFRICNGGNLLSTEVNVENHYNLELNIKGIGHLLKIFISSFLTR